MYIQPNIENKVKAFLGTSDHHMGDTLDISFTSFKKREVIATMPVNKHSVQPFGFLHGGASVSLAETLASVGAWINVTDDTKTAMGVEINANHMRAVKKGNQIKGIATPLQMGGRIQVWETKIFNDQEKLVCVSRCTLAVVDIR